MKEKTKPVIFSILLALFFSFLSFIWLITKPVWANNCPQLQIKWLVANPLSGQKERVKIYNPNLNPVNLSGWQLDDIAGGSKPIDLSGQLASSSSQIIEISSAMFNNSGDSCRLICQDKIIDQTSYHQTEKGQFWSRDINNQWCFTSSQPADSFTCPLAPPTPTLEPSPSPTAFLYPPAGCIPLTITKIDPAPLAGQKEKIKIYNPHNFKVDLKNYQIDDQENGAKAIDLTGQINSLAEKEIQLTTSIWNNSGDSIRLLCQLKVIDGLSYDSVKKGQIIVKDKNNQFCLATNSYWPVKQKDIDCRLLKNDILLPALKRQKPNQAEKRKKRKIYHDSKPPIGTAIINQSSIIKPQKPTGRAGESHNSRESPAIITFATASIILILKRRF